MSRKRTQHKGSRRLLDYCMRPAQPKMALAGNTATSNRRLPRMKPHLMETPQPTWRNRLSITLTQPCCPLTEVRDWLTHPAHYQCSPYKEAIWSYSPTTHVPSTQALATLPTTDNPASKHSLKSMLLSLQEDMQKEFRASINNLHDRLDFLEEHTEHIDHFSAAPTAHNTLLYIQDEVINTEIIQQLRLTWRINIKIRGAPEAITEIVPYLHQLFCKIVPSLTAHNLLIDWAHRIHKPQHLPASLPRDILV